MLKKDQTRFVDLQDVGCLPCRIKGFGCVPGDVHHLVEGRKRLGNDYTICLCPWHHRGIPPTGLDVRQAEEIAGPSLARNKKAFYDAFGSEKDLLETTNQALEIIQQSKVG